MVEQATWGHSLSSKGTKRANRPVLWETHWKGATRGYHLQLAFPFARIEAQELTQDEARLLDPMQRGAIIGAYHRALWGKGAI